MKQKIEIDEYIDKKVSSQEDLVAQLEKAKAAGLDLTANNSEAVAKLGALSDATPDDIIGALEVKGLTHDQIAQAQTQTGSSPYRSAKSALNWDPTVADGVPGLFQDPDAIRPVGRKSFESVIARLEIAAVELKNLATTAPHDWGTPSASSPRCAAGRQRRDVCIYQKAMNGQRWRLASDACAGQEKFLVNSPAQIRQALDSLDDRCIQVGTLNLHSHGSPGAMAMGLSISNVDAVFLHSNNLFAPDSSIRAQGCSVGKQCLGSVWMLKVARRAFANNPGRVSAPMQTMYFSPTTAWTSFDEDPLKSVAYAPTTKTGTWQLLNPKTHSATSLSRACGDEFKTVIERIKAHLSAAANRRHCGIAKYASSVAMLDQLLIYGTHISALPEAKLDNLRLRALANLSDLLTIEVNELDLLCK